MRLLTGVLLAGVVAVFGPVAPALADTDVNFESPSLANCTVVTTQYSGITFLTSAPENVGFLEKPIAAVVGAGARSPTHALQPAGDCSNEFPYPQLAFRLSQTRAAVSLYARSVDMHDIPVQLRAYDAGGTRIDQNGDTYTTLTIGGAFTQISAATNDNTNRIVTVVLKAQNPTLVQGYRVFIDDLHLTDGAGGTPPDFTLGPPPRLSYHQGDSDLFDIPVNRLNGSTGGISYSASDLPEGMTVGSSTESTNNINMRATVGRNTPPGDYTFTVTGNPTSVSAGSAPRSVSVPVTILESLPTITIANPAEGTLLDRAPFELSVDGDWTSLRGRDGPSQVCVVVTHTADQPGFPSPCPGVTGTAGHFTQDVGASLTPGPNYIWAFIRDNTGHVAVASRLLTVADETTGVDLRITGIEITQGTQYNGSNGLALPQGTPDNTTRYRGVQLVQNRTLWVRVFADTNRPARSDGRTPNVTARLRVLRGGVDITGGPLMPVPSARDLAVGGTWLTDREMGDFDAGYLFTIPASLTGSGPITLEAQINEETHPIIECATCAANDRLRVTDLRFRPVRTREVFPIRFIDSFHGSHSAGPDPVEIFAQTRRSVPFPLVVHPYIETVDITGDLEHAERDRADRSEGYIIHHAGDYERDHNPPGAVIGIDRGVFAGLTMRTPFCCDPLRIEEFAIVTEERPLTSVAHEYGHTELLQHADHTCDGPAGGGSDDGWPDPDGRIWSVVFNVDQHLAAPPTAAIPPWYDYMSYCANNGADNDSWLSARNWDRLVDHEATGGAARVSRVARARGAAIAPAGGPGLSVYELSNDDGSGGVVTTVEPTDGNAQGSDAAGDAQITVTGADGKAVTTNVASTLVHVNVRGKPAQRMIAGVVPAGADPRSVTISIGGQVIATRTASANAPTVKLVAPRAGSTVGKSLTVKWSGKDADGDPLTYSVDEASGPKAKFRVVASGVRGSSVKLPLTMLEPAAKARFRVRALDGFRQGTAVVSNIRVPAAPPQVSILEPGRGATVAADAIVSLVGQGFGAGSKRLTGRALTWRVDGRKVGTGERAMTSGLRPGTRTITLTAKSGRLTGVARLKLKVTKVTPRLLSTGAPAKLSRKARTLTLSLAASVPSTVRASAGGAAVKALLGRNARKVRIKVKPGSKALTVKLKLTGGGRSATETLKITR